MLALSTAYFTLRTPEPDGEEIVRGALDLGFRALEIDYRVTDAQMRRMGPVLLREDVALVSVHHPFPRDPEADPRTAHAAGPLLTSIDPDERRAAVRQAFETLARAADMGVGAVVVHVGRVDLPPDVDALRLEAMCREGLRESPEYEALRSRVAEARAAAAPAHRDATLSSLDRVAGEAVRRGLWVGLENRYHPPEIPDRAEMETIFRELEGAPLGYWHDTGHAASQVLLGFLGSHTELLEAFRDRLLGIHLHDARGLDDHLAPGEGELDFTALAPLLREEARRVLEVHPRSPARALERAREMLEEAGLAGGTLGRSDVGKLGRSDGP